MENMFLETIANKVALNTHRKPMHLLDENKELIGEVSCHILAAEHKGRGLLYE